MSSTDSKEPDKQLAVRVPLSQYQRLDDLARADHRTISQEIRRLIAERLSGAEATT